MQKHEILEERMLRRFSGYTLVLILIGGVAVIALPSIVPAREAFAYSCNAVHGSNCYAADLYFPYSSVNGLRTTNKVMQTTVTGYLVSPTWLTLIDGNMLEVGWIQNQGASATYYWGYGEMVQNTWGSPASASTHTFEVSDMNQDKTFNMKVDGVSYYTKTVATSWSNRMDAGYEFTYTETTLLTNELTSKQYGRMDTGWSNWNAANAASHYVALTPATGYFVKWCGTGDEQYYHSKHGAGSLPPTC